MKAWMSAIRKKKLVYKLKKFVKKMGAELSINIIDTEHQYHYWYGGCVAKIKFEGYIFSIEAIGDIYAELLDEELIESLAYVKDKYNSGAFYDEMTVYLDNDRQLSKAISQARLLFDHNNWWECFLITPNKEFKDLMLALESDKISDAVKEVACSMQEIIKAAG